MSDFDLPAFAKVLDSKAQFYGIGTLQQLRSELHGRRRAGRNIFTPHTTTANYAFHNGGRSELQFNIGTDGTDGTMLRYGVAFSFETSRSLPTIDPLIPKVRLFNDFLQLYPDLYADMRIWHWRDDSRSSESLPGPIPYELVSKGVFVFLGHLSSVQELDCDRILAEMDRLLPLYEYVESKGRRQRLSKPDKEQFVFRPGCTSKAAATKASYAQQELDVNLRHNLLQLDLYRRLVKKHGADNVGTELPTSIGTSVDLVVRQPNGYWFYEIKTSVSPRACIKEAVGQLLEYAFWPGSQEAHRLIVVGETAAGADVQEYCRRLNERFSLPIQYQQIVLEGS